MTAVADHGGRIRWQVSVVKALASALTIGSGDVGWPAAAVPVSVLRGRELRRAGRGTRLAPGDRVSLLLPAPAGAEPREPEASGAEPSR